MELILKEMEHIENNGHSYATFEELVSWCIRKKSSLSRSEVQGIIFQAVEEGRLKQEGNRFYLPQTKDYEDMAAEALAELLLENNLPHVELPEIIAIGKITLTDEQRSAVSLALDHRLSVILGGGGTGKTTLVQAILRHFPPSRGPVLLCAPTGKAACRLGERTGTKATTVHAAFESAFREEQMLPYGLVIVDEAGMMSLEMLAWVLTTISDDCQLVLVGDPNQLPSVKCGRVVEDLLEMGVPHIRLKSCHRQNDTESALAHNIQNFSQCAGAGDLWFDESFRFIPAKEEAIRRAVCEIGARLYREGRNAQVLSPYRKDVALSTNELNDVMQRMLRPGKGEALYPLRDGDRVMAIQNDRTQNVFNGETGILRLLRRERAEPLYQITCGDRKAVYEYRKVMEHLALAYAITVHKSQGSEYDTIVLPVSKQFLPLMTRNLFYTAISRAKKQVVLVGDTEALALAMRKLPIQRRSMLAKKVNQLVSSLSQEEAA